jgi:hypothetical protein
MTPTPGRILHVGYGLPGITNAETLPCRVAVVCGGLTAARTLPVTVYTMNPAAPVILAYVDLVNGWHDPRSCVFPWPQGDNDGERSDPNPIGSPMAPNEWARKRL